MAKYKASAGRTRRTRTWCLSSRRVETTWPTVAEAFSLDDAVVDTEAPTDEEPDEDVAPPSIHRDDAPPPPPPAATQTFAAPEFQNTLLYNIID